MNTPKYKVSLEYDDAYHTEAIPRYCTANFRAYLRPEKSLLDKTLCQVLLTDLTFPRKLGSTKCMEDAHEKNNHDDGDSAHHACRKNGFCR